MKGNNSPTNLAITFQMNTELDTAINQVYKKVGRNVVYLQKFEARLKHITARSAIKGYESEIPQTLQKQIESLSKHTLGQVAGLFIDKITGDNIDLGPDDPKENWINVELKISDNCAEKLKSILMTLVGERNKLVHQFDKICDFASLENCTHAENFLDQQYDLICNELKSLNDFVKNVCLLTQSLQVHQENLFNSLLIQCFDLIKHSSILFFGKITSQIGRADGWTVLSRALGHLNHEDAVELKALRQTYQCKTIKDILLKAEVFEWLEETTEKDEKQLLYRVKPAYLAWLTDGEQFTLNTPVTIHLQASYSRPVNETTISH